MPSERNVMLTGKPRRVLLVARHASAEPESLGATDHERDLTRAGKAQAAEGREWLESNEFGDSVIWASDATRTMSTAAIYAGGDASRVQAHSDLYNATVMRMFSMVAESAAETEMLTVVAHQPAVSAVVATLTGRHLSYPPGTIVAVGIDCPWSELEQDCGAVHGVFRPEAHTES